MNKLTSDTLNALLDKYEASKSLYNENKQTQSFTLVLFSKGKRRDTVGSVLFDRYIKGEDGLYRMEFETVIRDIENEGFIQVKRQGDVINEISLVNDKIPEIYAKLGRISKIELDFKLRCNLQRILKGCEKTPITKSFIEMLIDRLNQHLSVTKYCSSPRDTYYLTICKEIEANDKDTYLRNFSKRVTGFSKYVERMESKIMMVFNHEIDRYGTFEELLIDYRIYKAKTPTLIKGQLTVDVRGQRIDIGDIGGEFALSDAMMKKMTFLECRANKVITVENQTTFFDYEDDDAIIVYLGGYASGNRITFLKALQLFKPELRFFHFGDIDWGGFQIFMHLKRMTGIDFEPLFMDAETLYHYRGSANPLTNNDIKKLRALKEKDDHPFGEVIELMLSENIKLEQESLSDPSNQDEEVDDYLESLSLEEEVESNSNEGNRDDQD